MVDGETSVLPNPQDVQGGGNGAFAGRQDRAHRQESGFTPGPGVKQMLKGSSRVTMTAGRVGILDLL